MQDETGADNTISTTTCSAEHVTHNIRQCHTTTWPVARYVELPSINKHKHIVTQNNNLGTTPRDDQDQAEHNSQVKGHAEQCRAWDEGDEGQTDSQNEAVEDRSQAEQYQPSKKMGQAEQKTIAENEGMRGPCHLYGGGAPPQQINTRACGQPSQENDEETKSSQPTSLVPRPKKTEEMSVASTNKYPVMWHIQPS